MTTPDHLSGGIRGAATVLLASAAGIMLLGIFAAEQMVSLMGWPPWPVLADFVFRYTMALVAFFATLGLILLLIAARPKTLWIAIALIGLGMNAVCGILVIAGASSSWVGILTFGVLIGSVLLIIGAIMYERLVAKTQFTDPHIG